MRQLFLRETEKMLLFTPFSVTVKLIHGKY